MATFVKQAHGETLVRVRVKGYPPVSRQFRTKIEAREWAAVIEGDMRTGAWHDPSSVRRPRADNARSRRLNPAEKERLFAALATCLNPLVVPAVKMLLASAMRCGEMLQVRWNDIDYQNTAIYLHKTKNGRPRTVPLTLAAEAVLKSLPQALDGTQRTFDGLTYEGLKQAFVRARKRGRLIDFRLHDL